MSDSPRLAVVVSDLHVGSTVAVMPAEYETHEGQFVRPNPLQRWFLDCWGAFYGDASRYMDGDPFVFVVNGDAIDGDHHGTKQVWTKSMGDQRMAAVKLLRPWADIAHSLYVVEGTECHTHNQEHLLAHELGAVRNITKNQSAWERLDITIAGCPVAVRHHYPTTSRKHLQASQSSIQMADEQVRRARVGHKCPKVLLGAHRHEPDMWTDWFAMTLITPAWQGKTRYVNKVVPQAVITCGGYVLDWRNREDGDLPHVEPFIYTTPEPEEVVA